MLGNKLLVTLLCAELSLISQTYIVEARTTRQRDYRNVSSISSATNLYNYYKLAFYKEGLEHLLSAIITKISDDINCLAIINDNVQQDVFGGFFFRRLSDIPYYKVLIGDKEDMQSPNYHTLSVIRHVKRSSCDVYVLLLSNGGKISRFLRFCDKNRVIDTRAKFIILYDHQLFHSSLNYLWKKIVNIIFLRQHGRHQQLGVFRRKQFRLWYDISTVPFPTPIRKIFIPHRLDTWHQDRFQRDKELFKDKTSNLKGEKLRVVTFNHLPGTVKQGPRSIRVDVMHGTSEEGFGGVELEILWTLAKLMNFKPSVYEAQFADKEKWGRKQLNGSYSGLIGEIGTGQADMALGNLYYTPYYLELMDLTIPYTTECLTFLTPEALTNNSWMTLILPFKPMMWAAVITAMALAGFVFYALANYYHYIMTSKSKPTKKIIIVQEKNKKITFKPKQQEYFEQERGEGLYLFSELVNAFLYTYGMLLMVSLPKFPSGWSLRVLTGWFWVYCILLVVSYRASMTANLANPPPRITIDTMEQLVDSKITCGGWGEEVKQFFLTSLDPAGQKIGLKFEVIYNTDDAIERIAKGEFAYYENIYYLQYLRVKRQVQTDFQKKFNNKQVKNNSMSKQQKEERNLHIMHDCVIHMPISLGLVKNSPLIPSMNRYLQRIIEAGLVKKWLNDAIIRIMSEEIAIEKQNSKALMNLEKLYGAIVALGIGYFMSICILIGEVIHWQCFVKKDPFYDKYNMTLFYKQKKLLKKSKK